MSDKKIETQSWHEWLKKRDPKLFEVATSTADVAIFARPVFSEPVRRNKKDEKK